MNSKIESEREGYIERYSRERERETERKQWEEEKERE